MRRRGKRQRRVCAHRSTQLVVAFVVLVPLLTAARDAEANPPEGEYELTRTAAQRGMRDGKAPSCNVDLPGSVTLTLDAKNATIDSTDWKVIEVTSRWVTAAFPEPTKNVQYYVKFEYRGNGRVRGAFARWKNDDNGRMVCGDTAPFRGKYLGPTRP